MGERNGSWESFTYWTGTPTGPLVHSIIAKTGSRGENETITWKQSVILNILTTQQSNCTTYAVDVEMTAGHHIVLTDVLASILMIISIISNVVVLAMTIYRWVPLRMWLNEWWRWGLMIELIKWEAGRFPLLSSFSIIIASLTVHNIGSFMLWL